MSLAGRPPVSGRPVTAPLSRRAASYAPEKRGADFERDRAKRAPRAINPGDGAAAEIYEPLKTIPPRNAERQRNSRKPAAPTTLDFARAGTRWKICRGSRSELLGREVVSGGGGARTVWGGLGVRCLGERLQRWLFSCWDLYACLSEVLL